MAEPVGISVLWEDKEFRQGVLNYLNSMVKMQEQTNKAVNDIVTKMDKVGKSTKKAGDIAAKSSKKWSDGMKGMMRMGRQLLPVLGLLGASRAVSRFVKDSINEFRTFQKGMAEVFTLIPRMSEGARISMEADTMALARAHGRLTDEVVPALYQAISAGVPPDNVMSFMETASKAARGGVSDLKTSVDILTTIVNAYGREVITAEKASDILFAAVQGGKVTFTELAKTAFNIVPVAASLGVKFEDVGAAIAAMTKQGVPARTATTQLRQVLINVSQEGREAAEVFERVAGVSFAQFIARGGNLYEAMQIIEKAAADLNVTAADLFGNIRAGQGALVLTGAGGKLFANELDRARNSAGAMNEAALTMEESLDFAIGKANATKEALMIMVGSGLEPATRAMLDLFDAATKTFVLFGEWSMRVEAASKDTQDAVSMMTTAMQIDLARGIMASLRSFGLLERSVSNLSGASGEYLDTVEALAVGMITTAKSTDEAEKRLRAAFGTSVKYDKANQRFVITLDNINKKLFISDEALAQAVNSTQELTEADLEQIAVTQAQIEAQEAEVEAIEELEIQYAKLIEKTAEYAQKLFDTDDLLQEFNDLLIDSAIEAGASSSEVTNLGVELGLLNQDQAQGIRLLGQVKQHLGGLILSMERSGMTYEEIIDLVQELYGERLTGIAVALEEAETEEEITKAREESLATLEKVIATARAFQGEQGTLFSQMIEGKDEVGFFTASIEGLGQQWVRVGGRTAEQNRILGELTDQHDKADLSIRDYQAGVKGLTMEEDERNDKIAEQSELMGLLSDKMGDLQNITGSLVSVYVPAILNQETMNEELFKAAEGSGASAFALAALGVQLGIFTEEEAKAALKAAAMASKVEQLGKRIADGSISVEGAIVLMNNFAEVIDEEYVLQLSTGGLEKPIEDIESLGEKIKDVEIPVESAVVGITRDFVALSNTLGTELDVVEGRLGGLQEDMETTSDVAGGAAEDTSKDISTHWGDIETTLSEGAIAFADTYGDIEKSTKVTFENTERILEEMGVTNKQAIAMIANAAVEAYEEEFDDLPRVTTDILGDTIIEGEGQISEFYTLGGNLVVGLIDGAENQSGALSDTLSRIVLRALAAAEEAAETGSASRRMMRLGRDIIFGLVLGMDQIRRPAEISAASFIQMLMDQFEDLKWGIRWVARTMGIHALTDITDEFFEALHEKLGISMEDLEEYIALLNRELIPAIERWQNEIDRLISLADAFSSAGSTFAQMFTEDTLDPIRAMIDEIEARSDDLSEILQEAFDLTEEEILGRIPKLISVAFHAGDLDLVRQLQEFRDLQEERNAAEAEFAAEQERILELQRQQQQLAFLQAQLDLIRSLEEAGIDPADVLGDLTLGLEASLPDLIDAMNEALASLIDVVDEELEIGSPSKVFIEFGKQIMRGLGLGIYAGSQEINVIVDDAFRQTLATSIPPIVIASPVINVPVQAASLATANNYYFGDTFVGDQMDAALFQEQVRDVVAGEF